MCLCYVRKQSSYHRNVYMKVNTYSVLKCEHLSEVIPNPSVFKYENEYVLMRATNITYIQFGRYKVL